MTFQWRASHLRFLLQPRETKQATTISPLLQILLRIFVTIFVFLELYQCYCDFVNLIINHFSEEKIICFQKNILLHASKILRMEGWDTRKGACMTRYVRSAQVTLEVTGTGCYRARGGGGLRKQS